MPESDYRPASLIRAGQKLNQVFLRYRVEGLTFLILALVSLAAVAGYWLGTQDAVHATDSLQLQTGDVLGEHLAGQKLFCEAVERINVEVKLDQERSYNTLLAESLEVQQEAIEQQQQEMEDLESRILRALIANYSDQLISRSSSGVDGYVQEARNLIDLSSRLNQFNQTEDSEEIDLSEYRQALDNRLTRIPTLRPVWGRISSGFGYRTHPIYRHRHFHSGIDIVAPSGTSIRAAATGYVSEAGYHRSMGNYIKISHGNGFTTVYMHCRRLHVKAGDTVKKGQVIAAVGSTGTSTGPHLHYEVHLYGNPVNPTRFILE